MTARTQIEYVADDTVLNMNNTKLNAVDPCSVARSLSLSIPRSCYMVVIPRHFDRHN